MLYTLNINYFLFKGSYYSIPWKYNYKNSAITFLNFILIITYVK